MNSNPKVTAVVPSYNHGGFLLQRLESILQQSYQNVEVIVIDDCSGDDSDAVIKSILERYDFQYIRNPQNSGTPFAAWEKAVSLATGDYIWICESDDFADLAFLETAVDKMQENPNAVLFYCDSWVVDKDGKHVGHTDTYFRDIWRESHWDHDFTTAGVAELADYQSRGQTVPNMSSALILTKAFMQAYNPILKRFKLTGDWLFVGWLMRYGQVVYCKKTLSNFRKHEETARVRVKSARSQAEFVLTKYLLFRETGKPLREFATNMSSDVIRFLYEPARWFDVLKIMFKISPEAIPRFGIVFLASLVMNGFLLKTFYQRYKQVKGGKKCKHK
ncbi:MAG: glycosyltransferase [Halieaceae bacterium]|nr:glycosyltransferase [Halieaceae bacterium]